MDILHVARRFSREDWGGTETVILETSKELIRRGHRPALFATTATAVRAEETIEGLRVKRFPYFYPYLGLSAEAQRRLDKKGGSPFSFSMLWALGALKRLDLVHLHVTGRIGGIGRSAARARGVPYVVTLHGGVFRVPREEAATWTAPARGSLEWGKALGWWVGSRRVLADAAAIICVDREERALAEERLPGRRVVHLPNGVDAARFEKGDGPGFRRRWGVPTDAIVLLVMARVDPQKNQLLALHALRALVADEPRLHLLIVGPATDPGYLAEIERAIGELGLKGHVTLTGGLDGRGQEVVDAYHASDVLVLPSTHEPFGIVILEAWAAGIPVVASRAGGIPTFTDAWLDALLFEPGSVTGLVEALRAVISRPALRRALAVAGQRKAREQFSWESVTRRLTRLYDEVLREAQGPLR